MVSRQLQPLGHTHRLQGQWAERGQTIRYRGPDVGAPHPLGIAIFSRRSTEGVFAVRATLSAIEDAAARILIGYRGLTEPFLSVGIGGHNRAYVVSEWMPDGRLVARKAVGDLSNISAGTEYSIQVAISQGQIRLYVDSVQALTHEAPSYVNMGKVGLYAWGNSPVVFRSPEFSHNPLRAFVVMEFSEKYQRVYREVIQPAAAKARVLARSVGERLGAGIILEDIYRGIQNAAIVIAEVSPANQNVYYEVGYAHALKKPVILLARRGMKLPFDLRAHRCLFYDNNKGGRVKLTQDLYRAIQSTIRGQKLK